MVFLYFFKQFKRGIICSPILNKYADVVCCKLFSITNEPLNYSTFGCFFFHLYKTILIFFSIGLRFTVHFSFFLALQKISSFSSFFLEIYVTNAIHNKKKKKEKTKKKQQIKTKKLLVHLFYALLSMAGPVHRTRLYCNHFRMFFSEEFFKLK